MSDTKDFAVNQYSIQTQLINYKNQAVPFYKFIYLFLAALGLHCCPWAFSSCNEQGLLFIVVRGLRTVVASLVAEHGL